MTQISEYLKKIKSYCDFYLEFDTTNKRYKFNERYADEINCELFENEIEYLLDELYLILDDIKEPNALIEKINSILVQNLSWYKENRIFDFSSFYKLESNTLLKKKTDGEIDSIIDYEYTPSITKSGGSKIAKSNYISLDMVLDATKDQIDKEDELYYYLITHKSKTHNYKDRNDFEKVKLHYVIFKYFKSIISFRQNLSILHENIATYGIQNFNSFRPIKKPKNRCVVNLKKIEVATLFDALFKSNLFYFDFKSDKKNEKAKYDFINSNYSYVDRKNKVVEVDNINKEFDYIKSVKYLKRQKEIIDQLIDKLSEIKANL